MFCSRRSNSLVKKVHEKIFRIVSHDHNSSYSELFNGKQRTYYSSAKHQLPMKEIYKFKSNLSPLLIGDMFQGRKINNNLRHFQTIANTKKNSIKMGPETITYRAPQLWNLVPIEIKDAPSLSTFKEKIKSWYCDNCPCRLCRTYLDNVGFA